MVAPKLLILILEKIHDSFLECRAALCWSILDVILASISDEGCWDSVDGTEVRRTTGMLQATRTARKILTVECPEEERLYFSESKILGSFRQQVSAALYNMSSEALPCRPRGKDLVFSRSQALHQPLVVLGRGGKASVGLGHVRGVMLFKLCNEVTAIRKF